MKCSRIWGGEDEAGNLTTSDSGQATAWKPQETTAGVLHGRISKRLRFGERGGEFAVVGRLVVRGGEGEGFQFRILLGGGGIWYLLLLGFRLSPKPLQPRPG
jgi:hypothetical protein